MLFWKQSILFIYIITFLFNFLLEFESNTYCALMTNIFEKSQLLKAASTVNLVDSASMVIAPVSASFIAMHFSFHANLLLAMLLFIVASMILGFLKAYPQQTSIEKGGANAIKGYFSIIKDKKLLGTIFFWNLFMLCIGVTGPLEISMIEETLGMPSSFYGIGNTVEGIGMLVASGFIMGIISRLNPKDMILTGLFCSALSYLVIGLSGSIWIYFIGAGMVGMTSTFCPLGFKTEIQISSDPSVIGRTFAVARFTVLLSRIAGSVLVGQALDVWNIRKIYFGVFGVLIVTAITYGGFTGKSSSAK